MRKLKLQMQISLDGFVAGADGEMDWMVWNWDDELKNHVADLTAPVDLILLGRRLAEGFIDAWQSRLDDAEEGDFARKMVESPKIVFSRTLENFARKNTEISRGELVEKISQIKQTEGGDIIAYGGAQFAASLIKNNLIDEYHFFVNPVILGKGLAIFSGLEEKFNLQLVNAKTFSCGIAGLFYKPR